MHNMGFEQYALHFHLFAATVLEHAPLEAVYVHFDTATYDEIERDEKVLNSCTSKC